MVYTQKNHGYLKVEGSNITRDGEPILLKGASLGGWSELRDTAQLTAVLMENFMNGFAGQENQARAAMKAVLGSEKYEFYFDKFLEYYFTEADAKFIASMGFNCIRIAINYRHFEDDMNPRVLKKSGFKHLDRVVDLVSDEF